MTRNEFHEQITSMSDLIRLCNDAHYYDLVEDIYDEYGKDEYYNEGLVDMARNAGDWQTLYSELRGIPTGYDWYVRDYDGDLCGMTDRDIDEKIEEVYESLLEECFFDEEEPEEEPDELEEEEGPEESAESGYEIEDATVLLGLFANARAAVAAAEPAQRENADRVEEDWWKTLPF